MLIFYFYFISFYFYFRPQPRPKNVKNLKIKPQKISKMATDSEEPKVFDLWDANTGPISTAKKHFRSLKRQDKNSSAINLPPDVLEYNLKQMKKAPVKVKNRK